MHYLWWAFLTILFVLIVMIETRRIILSRRFKHIPGVQEVPVIGSFYTLTPNRIQDYRTIFSGLCFAPITKFFFAWHLIFLTHEPSVLQKVLNNSTFTERPYVFKFFRLKYGLISAYYKEWRPIRKAANPAFSQRMSIGFIPQFIEHFKNFEDEVASWVGKGEFDINEISNLVGIRLILETQFLTKDFDDDRLKPQLFEDYEDNVCQRIFRAYIQPDFLYHLSDTGRADKRIEANMRGIFEKVIKQRRMNKIIEESDGTGYTADKKPYLVDELIKFTDDNKLGHDGVLVENGITVFMAGYETSAMTMSYVALMLALHPEIDAKVEKEIFENYRPGDEINYEMLKTFPYLEMVIKETMRLYPTAPMTIRRCMDDVYINEIGQIDKGTFILCDFYNLHRSKEIWGPEADKFNPDNFLPERVAKRHPYSFLPFSAGPRMCIGYQYAQIAMKVGLLMLLSRFKFSTTLKLEDLQYKFSVTLKLLNKHMVSAHYRTYRAETMAQG